MRKTTEEGVPSGEAAKLAIYVYGREVAVAPADPNDQRHRVTGARIQEADEVQNRAMELGRMECPGPFHRAQLNHHLAGLPNMPTPENVVVPDTNVFHQARHMDQE